MSTKGTTSSSPPTQPTGAGKWRADPAQPPATPPPTAACLPTSLFLPPWVPWPRASLSVTLSLLESKIGVRSAHCGQSRLWRREASVSKNSQHPKVLGVRGVPHTLAVKSVRPLLWAGGGQGAREPRRGETKRPQNPGEGLSRPSPSPSASLFLAFPPPLRPFSSPPPSPSPRLPFSPSSSFSCQVLQGPGLTPAPSALFAPSVPPVGHWISL